MSDNFYNIYNIRYYASNKVSYVVYQRSVSISIARSQYVRTCSAGNFVSKFVSLDLRAEVWFNLQCLRFSFIFDGLYQLGMSNFLTKQSKFFTSHRLITQHFPQIWGSYDRQGIFLLLSSREILLLFASLSPELRLKRKDERLSYMGRYETIQCK
jgi:hypothetical protein